MYRIPRVVILATLFLTTLSSQVLAASAGQKCAKAGTKSFFLANGQKRNLVCTKVGKVLKWKPANTPVATAPAAITLTVSDEVDASDSTLHHISVNGGQKRDYLINVPNSYSNNLAVPLMIALHGRSWTAAGFRDLSQINLLSNANNFIVAYPDGLQNSWNAGNCCSLIGADDVTLISGMIDSISSKYNIDKTRVWALGWSNGGMMAYRLACELSEKVTAIAIGGAVFAADSCKPAKPVSVFAIHGTDDQTLPIEGYVVGPPPLKSAEKYAGYAGCTSSNATSWSCPNGSKIQVKIENGVGHYSQSWWNELTNFLLAHPRS